MSKIGVGVKDALGVKFSNMRALVVDPDHPDAPQNPGSHNEERVPTRLPGYQNPVLGDAGRGQIERWSRVSKKDLELLLDQIIEHYVKDRDWYSTVRCREALYNMFRRIEWWVKHHTEPNDSGYANAMAFIWACMKKILDPAYTLELIYFNDFSCYLDSPDDNGEDENDEDENDEDENDEDENGGGEPVDWEDFDCTFNLTSDDSRPMYLEDFDIEGGGYRGVTGNYNDEYFAVTKGTNTYSQDDLHDSLDSNHDGYTSDTYDFLLFKRDLSSNSYRLIANADTLYSQYTPDYMMFNTPYFLDGHILFLETGLWHGYPGFYYWVIYKIDGDNLVYVGRENIDLGISQDVTIMGDRKVSPDNTYLIDSYTLEYDTDAYVICYRIYFDGNGVLVIDEFYNNVVGVNNFSSNIKFTKDSNNLLVHLRSVDHTSVYASFYDRNGNFIKDFPNDTHHGLAFLNDNTHYIQVNNGLIEIRSISDFSVVYSTPNDYSLYHFIMNDNNYILPYRFYSMEINSLFKLTESNGSFSIDLVYEGPFAYYKDFGVFQADVFRAHFLNGLGSGNLMAFWVFGSVYSADGNYLDGNYDLDYREHYDSNNNVFVIDLECLENIGSMPEQVFEVDEEDGDEDGVPVDPEDCYDGYCGFDNGELYVDQGFLTLELREGEIATYTCCFDDIENDMELTFSYAESVNGGKIELYKFEITGDPATDFDGVDGVDFSDYDPVWMYENSFSGSGEWFVRHKGGGLESVSDLKQGIYDKGVTGNLIDRFYYWEDIVGGDRLWKVVRVKSYHLYSNIAQNVTDMYTGHGGTFKFDNAFKDSLSNEYGYQHYTTDELLRLVDSVYVTDDGNVYEGWDSSNLLMDENISQVEMYNNGFYFKEVSIKFDPGKYCFVWRMTGAYGNSYFRFNYIKLVERIEDEDIDKGNIPLCPLPYYHSYKAHYVNYFDGSNPHVPYFSTKNANHISDFHDLLRYWSSHEHMEWIHKVDEGGVNVFELPLYRVNETLVSKITFNWRVRRHGYFKFKYRMVSADESEIMAFVNDSMVSGPHFDSDEWQEVFVDGFGSSQTYKFDIIVKRKVAMTHGEDSGHTGVLGENHFVQIKEVEVGEVIIYDDPPWPGDYDKHGELVTDSWKIYSKEGFLATYYRGYLNHPDDDVRTVEYKLKSECDGIMCFGFDLGIDDSDRYRSGGMVYAEPFTFNWDTHVWHSSITPAASSTVPTVSVTPFYGPRWYGKDATYYTFESDNITYSVESQGMDEFIIEGELMITNPLPEILGFNEVFDSIGFEYEHEHEGDCQPVFTRSGVTIDVDDEEQGRLIYLVENELAPGEYVDMFINGSFVRRFSHGNQVDYVFTDYLSPGSNLIEFDGGKDDDIVVPDTVVFRSEIKFPNVTWPDQFILREDSLEEKIIKASGELNVVSDWKNGVWDGEYGADDPPDMDHDREFSITLLNGRMNNSVSWTSVVGGGNPQGRPYDDPDYDPEEDWMRSGGTDLYEFTVKLPPGDVFTMNIPYNTIPYMHKDIVEVIDQQPNRVLYYDAYNEPVSDVNDIPHLTTYSFTGEGDYDPQPSQWKWIDIFEFFEHHYRGDGAILVDGLPVVPWDNDDEPDTERDTGVGLYNHVAKIDIPDGPLDGDEILSFEYGGRFAFDDHFTVTAHAGAGDEEGTEVFKTHTNDTSFSGMKITDIELPAGTTHIQFNYIQKDLTNYDNETIPEAERPETFPPNYQPPTATPPSYDDSDPNFDPSQGLLYPIKGYTHSSSATVISSPYGQRSSGMHRGIDLVLVDGNNFQAPIQAIYPGRVCVARDTPTSTSGWGSYVTIDHGNGYVSLYSHLHAVYVTAGETVGAGKTIGTLGATGNVFSRHAAAANGVPTQSERNRGVGSHLHFEIRQGDCSSSSPINPTSYVNGTRRF